MFRQIALRLQSVFNEFDPASEGQALDFGPPGLFPVFIIGVPRSGSTLLYQLLVKHTRLAFISNAMALIPSRMISLARVTKAKHRLLNLKTSNLGYIAGLFSPSEAGSIQRKWFDPELNPEDHKYIRNTIILLTDIFSGPFISKNLMNSLRLDTIRQILPEARYIFIKRAPLYNAQSILLSRLKANRSEQSWWSVQPEGYGEVENMSPKYQVVWQVLEIEKKITGFIQRSGAECIQINYEELCREPRMHIHEVAETYNLHLRNDVNFDPVGVKNAIKIPSSEWAELRHRYDELTERKPLSGSS